MKRNQTVKKRFTGKRIIIMILTIIALSIPLSIVILSKIDNDFLPNRGNHDPGELAAAHTPPPPPETPSPSPASDPTDEDDLTGFQLIENTSPPRSELSSDRRKIIAIDPGHQRHGNSTQEPIGPGSSATKAMVSSGITGVATGVPEYELNLTVSLLLRNELIARGYEVFMIRETHDVDISNRTRAEMATEAGAHIFVRIHANGSTVAADSGIMTISPARNTPFIPFLYSRSLALSQSILDGMVIATGAKNMGVWETDTMTGINWSTMPVTIIEMGFMSNPDEDRLLQTQEYQAKLVEGIADGIDLFFTIEFDD